MLIFVELIEFKFRNQCKIHITGYLNSLAKLEFIELK